MGWLEDHVWAGWLALALVLAAVETLTLDLVALMLAVGAAAGAVAAALGAPPVLQAVVACVTALGMLLAVRPVALRHLRPAARTRTGTAALVGRQAVVLERTDASTGRVKLAGEVWSARTYLPDVTVEPGSTVDVISIDGATAVVLPTGQ
ncbi:NfeD family protein [Motilibacter deserti]|uniref:NfeD family protein n=1 Tax=Motilibacter deserti TaxID=2714956 RepID=A0ABX0GWD0_9ACTN|nr:NfeD family protein [Motilibacter deserti]NHC14109.1 NfeD family protein [Motilibacter deserti]